jgi:hemoglobin
MNHQLNVRVNLLALALVCAGFAAPAARAQSSTPSTPAMPMSASTAAVDDALYREFGGQPGLVALVDDLMPRLLTDPRMNPFFKDTEQKPFKEALVTQFCEVSGGPCRRTGADMSKAHAGFDIRKSDFNALVEVLQTSMDAQGIAFAAQNRLLAKLAPMHRDIVNVP